MTIPSELQIQTNILGALENSLSQKISDKSVAQQNADAAQGTGNTSSYQYWTEQVSIADQAISDYQTKVTHQTSVVNYLTASYNQGLSQGKTANQKEQIAANAYVAATNTAREQSIQSVQDAKQAGASENDLEVKRQLAIADEERHQSAQEGAESARDATVNSAAASVDVASADDTVASGPSLANAEVSGDITDIEDDGTIVVTGQRPIVPKDNRVRLVPTSGLRDALFGTANTAAEDQSTILGPLRDTLGVMFPYTPAITFEHGVNYQQMTPTHANTDYYHYQNTSAVKFTINGKFTAQSVEEAKYQLAAMHFFRTVTKMRFGRNTENRGFGPPLCKLWGYGDYMFNDLPVIILSFSMELPENVNYVDVDIDGATVQVPSLSTFQISCVVQQSPSDHREEFNWDEFASGSLMSTGGWI